MLAYTNVQRDFQSTINGRGLSNVIKIFTRVTIGIVLHLMCLFTNIPNNLLTADVVHTDISDQLNCSPKKIMPLICHDNKLANLEIQKQSFEKIHM